MRIFLILAVFVLSILSGSLGLPCFDQFLKYHSVGWRPDWNPRFPVRDIWPPQRGHRPGLLFERPTQRPMIPKHPFPMLSEYKSEHRDRVIVVLPPSITTTVRPVEEKPKIIVVLPPVAKILPTPFPSVKRQGGPKPNLSPRKGPKVVQTSKSVTTKSPLQYKFRQPTTIQKIFSYQTQKPPPSPKPFDPFSLSPKTFTSSPLAPATATVTLTDDLTIQPASATVETGLTTTLSLAPSYPTFTELAKDVAATPEPVEIEQSGNGEDVETTLPPYRLESDIPVVIIGGAPEPVLENVHPVYSNPSLRGVSPEVL